MKTTYLLIPAAGALAAAAFLTASSAALAGAPDAAAGLRSYEVTITNLTRAQVFSPPVIATHNANVAMFEAGTPATPELAEMAENGNPAPLVGLLAGSLDVLDVQSAAAGLPPGASVTFTVRANPANDLLSAVGMLVSTNDSFFGLDRFTFDPMRSEMTVLVPAYDSGTEYNSEDCAYVPGPPCGAGPVHDPRPAEGFVYVNNGIHGIGGVPQAEYDWRNPVARIHIRRQ